MLRSEKIELGLLGALACAIVLIIGFSIPWWVGSVPYARTIPSDDILIQRAEFGYATEQLWLGERCEKGKKPCAQQDYASAASWYKKSAEQGHPRAAHKLGRLYLEGLGVPQDYEEAYFWLKRKRGLQSSNAQIDLKIAESKLSSEKKGLIQKRIDQWSPHLSSNLVEKKNRNALFRVFFLIAAISTPFILLAGLWRCLRHRKIRLPSKILLYVIAAAASFLLTGFWYTQRLNFLSV